jgi:hypothetical protein
MGARGAARDQAAAAPAATTLGQSGRDDHAHVVDTAPGPKRLTGHALAIPRSTPGSSLRARWDLASRLGREVPAPARAAETRARWARAVALPVPARDGSHRSDDVSTAGVADLRAVRHVDLPRLVALGGLTSCPVRASRLIANQPSRSLEAPPAKRLAEQAHSSRGPLLRAAVGEARPSALPVTSAVKSGSVVYDGDPLRLFG